jgi:general secretion pathway protein D
MAVGEEADVQLLLPAGAPLRGMAVDLWLDSAKLQALRVSEGELFKRDGEDSVFTSSLDAKGGRLRAGSMRKTATAATGPGTLLSLRVKAIAAGAAVIKLDGGQPVVMLPPIPTLAPSQWTVNVR